MVVDSVGFGKLFKGERISEVGSSTRHQWYFVKEGFPTAFVERVLEREDLGDGDIIVDPFCGGGTTAVVGCGRGHKVFGAEVNPFLHLVSNAKVTALDGSLFREQMLRIVKEAERSAPSPLEGFSTFSEGNRWNRWLFPTAVLRSFEAARQAIHDTPGGHRDVLLLALIGAAMDCCNATRDGKCLRYKREWMGREATAADFRSSFSRRCDVIAKDLDGSANNYGLARIVEGDVRSTITTAFPSDFRLCITSPPYLNSFDYTDVYRPELFLGSFVSNMAELRDLRLRTIRSHVQADWARPVEDDFGTLYSSTISEIQAAREFLWDKRIPLMIQAYFEDMRLVLSSLRVRGRDDSALYLVVSTSAYAGIEVPVDLILAEIGQRVGWSLREIVVLRNLRSSSQHVRRAESGRPPCALRESLVTFGADHQFASFTKLGN
jgi:hypothetical protein